MARIGSPLSELRSKYDVVVIGSGYGGAITASRLARAHRDVCLLERGKEFEQGAFPDTQLETLREMQLHAEGATVGAHDGLYQFNVEQDITVFHGCGLGGTSLVNANVSLEAEPRVLSDPRWPAALRADADGQLKRGFAHATDMLRPTPYPREYPPLHKLEALGRSADSLARGNTPDVRFYPPPINVNFTVHGPNHVGVEQAPCTLCGDCVTGCNHGAKNTLLMNYLPDAAQHGAAIFTGADVDRIERENDGSWTVHFTAPTLDREAFGAAPLFVRADVVIVAGGALGSTEILLRSRAAGLACSEQVGRRFTGNGDVLAFDYNAAAPTDGVGFGSARPAEREPVGPCITGIIDLRRRQVLQDGMVIEEGSLPSALAHTLPLAFAAASAASGVAADESAGAIEGRALREAESLALGPYTGAMKHTQTFLVMTHDDGNGEMYLDNDRVRLRWPSVGQEPIFQKVDATLRAAGVRSGGVFIRDPIWSRLAGRKLITVHPLGGCVMADDAKDGVVDERCRVFRDAQGNAVHDGLYVCDGAVIPRPLGVNPLLTISAVAERCAALIAQDRGWTIDYALPRASWAKPLVPVDQKPGLSFTETMRGFMAPDANGYEAGAELGQSAVGRGDEAGRVEFTVTILFEDLDASLRSPRHEGRIIGTVTAPALSRKPLEVAGGRFNLFTSDNDNVETVQMRYSMRLASEEGQYFQFDGVKRIHDDPGPDLWSDTTTLYADVTTVDRKPVLKGILRIALTDFIRQLGTLRATNAGGTIDKLRIEARFGKFFAGTLYNSFGSIFARPTEFDPDAPPRKRRPLRVGVPEIHKVETKDGVIIRLTRYQGGKKGPVMLSHGLGVSSGIFTIDTIDTNLLEYLHGHGYDVWLLDYRASIDLPASSALATADTVAECDYPAAVAAIRRLTGAPSIQALVHCYGSTTFFMSMLRGLEGVRSFVASQIATRIVTGKMTSLKAGLHLPDVLEAFGVDSMTAFVDKHADWKSRAFDLLLKLNPVPPGEMCRDKVCHRITFLYSLLYEHAQLNEATHDALHEMFGVANMDALKQLARLVRTGHLVTSDGRDDYITPENLRRLAVPIAFIHGEKNECFHPESTELTVAELSRANGAGLYKRHVIPGYGHIDCIYGKNAARDVYPHILAHLEETAITAAPAEQADEPVLAGR
jgi:cholesterol oxidase